MTDATLVLKVDSREVKIGKVSLDDLAKSGEVAEKSTNKLTDSNKKLSDSAKYAAGALTALAGSMVIRQLTDYTNRWTDLNSRLVNATGSQKEADKAMAGISQTARTTYSSLELTAESFLRNSNVMKELGYNTKEQLTLSDALNNSLVISATKGQRAESVMNAFSKALAIGKLSGENFNSVVQGSDRLTKALAEGLGVTTIELRAMAEAGEITSEKMVKALTSIGPALAQEADAMAATIADGTLLMGNSVLELVGRMDGLVGASSAVSGALKGTADKIREIAKDEQRLAEITETVTSAVTALAVVVASRYVVSMAAATQQTIAHQLALARIAGLSATAAAGQTALAGAATAASRAMALAGGPLGLVTLAAGALVYFAAQGENATEKTARLRREVDDLTQSFEDLTVAQLDNQIAEEQRRLNDLAAQRNGLIAPELDIDAINSTAYGFKVSEYKRLTRELDEALEQSAMKASALAQTRQTAVTAGLEAEGAATRTLTAETQAYIDELDKKIARVGMSERELTIATAADKIAAETTEEGREAILSRVAALYDMEEALEASAKAEEAAKKAMEDSAKANGKALESLLKRIKQTEMSARQQFIDNELMKLSEDATLQLRIVTIALADAQFYKEQALLDANEAARDAIETERELARESERVAEQMAEDWAATREAFGDFFADMVQDGDDAFEALLKSFERMLLEMTGQLALSGIMSLFGIPVPGSASGGLAGIADSSGIAGTVAKALAAKYGDQILSNTGFGSIANSLPKQLQGPVQPGQSPITKGFDSAEFVSGLKTVGMNIGASFVGGYAGGAAGEAIFGKEAESAIGESIGSAVGAAVVGPLGALVGSFIGSLVDVAAGGDGKVRQNAGFVVAPTPGLKPEYAFSSPDFESGLNITGVSRRGSEAQANDVINIFRNADAAITALVKELGGNLDLSNATLAGLDEEATPGSSGTFLGMGGNGALAGDLAQQLNYFVEQLAKHVTGIDAELLSSIQSAGSAENAITILSGAVLEQAAASDAAKAAAVALADAEKISTAAKVEAEKIEQQIAEERAGLQEQYDRLTLTSAELMERQRNSLDESNRGLFDQIVAINAANEAQQKANEAATLQNSLADQYSDVSERGSAALEQIISTFRGIGLEAPGSVEALREMILAMDPLTEAGQVGLEAIDGLSGAIRTVIQITEEATRAEAQRAAEIGRERQGLQDQLDSMTMSTIDLLNKQRDALDESNRALFDQIEAAKEAEIVAQTLADSLSRIADERAGLQDRINALTDTQETALARQRNALDESNRALFDQIILLEQKAEAEQLAARAIIEAENEAIRKAEAIATQRTALQDDLDELTLSSVELIDKQRNALDESNRSLFDRINLLSAEKAASDALNALNAGLQSQIDDLVKASLPLSEQRALETAGMDESTLALQNRIYQLIDEATAAQAAAQAASQRAAAEAEAARIREQVENNRLRLTQDLAVLSGEKTQEQVNLERQLAGVTDAATISLIHMINSLTVAKAESEAAQKAVDDLARAWENAAKDAKDAVTRTMRALTDAVKLERDATTAAYKESSDAIAQRLTGLTSLSEALRGAVGTGADQTRAQAQAQLLKALDLARVTGQLPIEGQLQPALDVLAKPSMALFSSFAEYQRDFVRTAQNLSDLADIADSQAATVRTELDVLTSIYDGEMARLDSIIDNAQSQLDALNSIDNTILSVAQNVERFNALIAVAFDAANKVGTPEVIADRLKAPVIERTQDANVVMFRQMDQSQRETRQEMSELRRAFIENTRYTKKTADLLTRVTRDGESLLVESA